jgi:hypothetical protein
MKMLKVHQNAPIGYKHAKISKFLRGSYPEHHIKRGGDGWEGLGREGIGVWPTQKLSRGTAYDLGYPYAIRLSE